MTLQEQLDHLRTQGAPLPLIGMQGITQAMILRQKGLPYSAIAKVMNVYHGSTRSEHYWRRVLRERGAAPKVHGNGAPRKPPHERVS